MRNVPVFMVLALLLSTPLLASADALFTMTHQGYLLDTNDRPVDEPVKITLRLWKDRTATAANQQAWTDTFAVVPVSNGLYSLVLGDTSIAGREALAASLFSDDLYVGLTFNDGAELSPRLRIGTVPTAASAQLAHDLACVGCVSPEETTGIATLAGAQSIDGIKTFIAAPAFTAATGAPFSVTSTETVANLDADTLDGIDSKTLTDRAEAIAVDLAAKYAELTESVATSTTTAAAATANLTATVTTDRTNAAKATTDLTGIVAQNKTTATLDITTVDGLLRGLITTAQTGANTANTANTTQDATIATLLPRTGGTVTGLLDVNATVKANSLELTLGACAAPAELRPSTKECYLYVQLSLPWLEAEAYCERSFGGHLATVVDLATLDYLAARRDVKLAGTNPWLGHSDIWVEGTWKPVNGVAAASGYFTRWASGEPNGGSSENCAHMYPTALYAGAWNDVSCGALNAFICRRTAP